MTHPNKSQFLEGSEAFSNKIDVSLNPYFHPSKEHKAWEDGWKYAQNVWIEKEEENIWTRNKFEKLE